MTSWLRVRFRVDRSLADPLSEALEASGAIAVSIEGREDEHVLQAATENTTLWQDCMVTGLFPADTDVATLTAELGRKLAPAALEAPVAEPLADEDWEESWKAHVRPFEVAPGVWVCPGWVNPPDPAAVNLILEPGMAFGTGEHPTTALCLGWLTEQGLAGKTVIDYGTGSGILAMAALKLGAGRAIGIDIDPRAVDIARENLERNQMSGRFTACTPDRLSSDARADIVLANILANPLCELAPRLTGMLKPGGQLVLSGMLADQADDVVAAYRGLVDFPVHRERSGWVLLAGARRD